MSVNIREVCFLSGILHGMCCIRSSHNVGETYICKKSFCNSARKLVFHINKCRLVSCSFLNCEKGKELLTHFKECEDFDCQLCSCVRGSEILYASLYPTIVNTTIIESTPGGEERYTRLLNTVHTIPIEAEE